MKHPAGTYTVIPRGHRNRDAMLRREIRSGIVDGLVLDGFRLEVGVWSARALGFLFFRLQRRDEKTYSG